MAAEDLVPELDIGEAQVTVLAISCECDEDNVRKGRFVTITDGENWPPKVHEADSGDKIGGVALAAGITGDVISVLKLGIVKMYAGGAVTAMDAVKTDDEGRAVKALAADQGLEGGEASMSAGEADDEFMVFVCPNNVGEGT